MIETAPQNRITRLDRKVAIIKRIASSIMMGIFSVMFVLMFGGFFFWQARLEDEVILILVIICTVIPVGLIVQTIATIGPLVLDLWRLETETDHDEPLFP